MKKGLFEEGDVRPQNNIEDAGLKEFGERISKLIARAKTLKAENQQLSKRVQELEAIVKKQSSEIEGLRTERLYLKKEIEQIMREIEELDI
ncbi:MAG: hypothetical protein N2257_06090 [Thermodesulfovibrionales bacterium]|nr:hypothetical protein [Thermodesulfovibrionales bacterium]